MDRDGKCAAESERDDHELSARRRIRVARSSRALVSASRGGELSSLTFAEFVHELKSDTSEKFVSAGRQNQRSGRACYPDSAACASSSKRQRSLITSTHFTFPFCASIRQAQPCARMRVGALGSGVGAGSSRSSGPKISRTSAGCGPPVFHTLNRLGVVPASAIQTCPCLAARTASRKSRGRPRPRSPLERQATLRGRPSPLSFPPLAGFHFRQQP